MRKRLIRGMTVFLLTILLITGTLFSGRIIPVTIVVDQMSEEFLQDTRTGGDYLGDKEYVFATVLGDSIAKGYASDKNIEIIPYGSLVLEQLSSEADFKYDIVNYAKNGLDTIDMNIKILSDPKVCESLKKSDIIFITLGSNDLLNTFKKEVQDILETDTKFRSVGDALDVLGDSVVSNPLLILKIIEALKEWDYPAFDLQWTKMMDTISSMKKDDAWIVVTNIYNPVINLELPSMMNQVVESVIKNMNVIMESHAQEYDYQVVDIFQSNVNKNVQNDGLHPDQSGQQIIAEKILLLY